MPTDSFSERTRQNVIDSDGTIIISHGKLSGGSALTQAYAEKYNRPYLHIDLNSTNPFSAVKSISYWLTHHDIEILNIAGPRQSKDPNIYDATKSLLKSALRMSIIDIEMPDPSVANPLIPSTVEEAVYDLISMLPLTDKVAVARLKEEQLMTLQLSFGTYIRNKYGLWSTNKALLESCRSAAGEEEMYPEDASALIVKEMWKKLRETHALRLVK
jgi:hypothetical protein